MLDNKAGWHFVPWSTCSCTPSATLAKLVSFGSWTDRDRIRRLTTIGRPHARPRMSADTSCAIVVLMDYPVLHGPSYCESSCCQALVMTTSPATGAASPETEGIVRKDWRPRSWGHYLPSAAGRRGNGAAQILQCILCTDAYIRIHAP